MKINKITVHYSATVQFRQFEPIVISASAEAQVDPNEKAVEVFQKVYGNLEKEINAQIKKIKEQRKSSFNDEDGLDISI